MSWAHLLEPLELVKEQLIGAVWDSPRHLRHMPGPGSCAMGFREIYALPKGQLQAKRVLWGISITAGYKCSGS